MIDVKAQFDQLFSEQERRDAKYRTMLPKTDDVSLVVLKGHLIIEEMLLAIVENHCATPSKLEHAKLSFSQLLHVTQALVRQPAHDELWSAIAQLNRIRNSLVHNLEPEKIDKELSALNQFCHSDDEPFPEGYMRPTEPAQIALVAISYIMGILSVLGPVTEFVERNRQLPNE